MSKDNQYDLTDVANALSILMTSDKTPESIHDAIADTLSGLEDAWKSKNIVEYSPEHLAEVLALDLENEQKETTAADTEGASEPERESITGEDLDVFARVLSKILKGGYVSADVQTHFCDAITQIDEDWRNATDDYESEDYIRKVVRGYFGEDLPESAAA